MKDGGRRDDMNTDTMDAGEFREWINKNWDYPGMGEVTAVAKAIASRDAYRERQALEKAVERFEAAWDVAKADNCHTAFRSAILGTTAFERGQLVRYQVIRSIAGGCRGEWAYAPYRDGLANAEPALDRAGNPVFLPVED